MTGRTLNHRTFEAEDHARNRVFPIDVWSPDHMTDPVPLLVFSHSSGGNRLSSSLMCSHLASRGYIVAALDHSERIAPELKRRDGETSEQRAARVDGMIAARVPDVRFLIEHMLGREDCRVDASRIGLVGHSFGGWSVLATPEVDTRIASIVAFAPGGSDHPLPGIIPAKLTFRWPHNVPVLLLAAENDDAVTVENVSELYERIRSPKRMFVVRQAGHDDFVDDVGSAEMHEVVNRLTLAHFDSTLRGNAEAARFLDGAAGTMPKFVYRV